MARAHLQDVAERAGVSTATASLVLRNRPGPSARTRERVRSAAEELDYRADRTASLLARRRSHLVGVVLDVTSAYHGELAVRLDDESARQGLDLVLVTTTPRRDEAEALATVRDSRCEAVLLLGSGLPATRLVEIDRDLPVVVLGRDAGTPRGPLDSVLVEDAAMMELAIVHLAERGHRRIAHVDGGRDPIAAARRRGYLRAMSAHGLSGQARVLPGGATEREGMAAATALVRLSSRERPTAVVAFNDRCALGVREVVLRSGLAVPDDLALVGVDDSPLARLATLSLTSIGQDPAGQAEVALRVLQRRLDGAPAVGASHLRPQLRVRGSS